MFQNVLMTSLTPLCDTNEVNQWQNRPFINSWPEPNHHKSSRESFVTKTIRKRNKRNRTSYTTEQLKVLERTFAKAKYINTEYRRELAESLNIGEKCIKVWFQNRRMKEKRESSESSDSSSEGSVEPITPPPVNTTPPSEDRYVIPNHYNAVNNTEEEAFYQYTNNNGISQLHAYYENYNTLNNTNYNVNAFANDHFKNDNNLYPTHYYPTEAEYANTYTNFNGYDQQKEEEQNWTANAFDFTFL